MRKQCGCKKKNMPEPRIQKGGSFKSFWRKAKRTVAKTVPKIEKVARHPGKSFKKIEPKVMKKAIHTVSKELNKFVPKEVKDGIKAVAKGTQKVDKFVTTTALNQVAGGIVDAMPLKKSVKRRVKKDLAATAKITQNVTVPGLVREIGLSAAANMKN